MISWFNKGEFSPVQPSWLFLVGLKQLLKLHLVVLHLSSKLPFGIFNHFLNQTISRISFLQEISVVMECVHVPLVQNLHEEEIMKNYQALRHMPMKLLQDEQSINEVALDSQQDRDVEEVGDGELELVQAGDKNA